ncbi:MAG: UTP--glucose-1-phosphate uridylyltransferase [Puniceicoccales bacterium]|jgi:UDP-N-acetylglucosamine/UDP-N-acetylgalactosamine diphosphorylase|nr:UTP--glucose-1-phosphate uridylyltransferase [Puniceicoccales bacterium]
MKGENRPLEDRAAETIERFVCYGQGQVFRFWDTLSGEQRLGLLQEAEQLDLPKISEYVRQFLFPKHSKTGDAPAKNLSSPPYLNLPETRSEQIIWEEAYKEGEAALADGRVAVLTLAGGQATRLGRVEPKGTLEVTPVRKKSLFQVLAEKIRFAEQRYGRPIHWFLMTSRQNHEATLQFFRQHKSFGLQNIHFFQQGLLPAVDFQGKILLEAKDHITMQPNGSGGAIPALVSSGSVKILRDLGVDIISLCQVENPLVNVIDPHFIGFHLQQKSEISFRVIQKSYPEEPVGIFAAREGKTIFIEYTSLQQEQLLAQEPSGKLQLHVANAGIYLLDREFVQTFGRGDYSLSLHIARKKVPTIDLEGHPISTDSPNGLKFEQVLPDLLTLASRFLLLEGRREQIFSPIKNAQGLNSLQTCHQDQLKLFTHWLLRAGQEIPTDNTGLPPFAIEISPLFADNERTFLDRWATLPLKPNIAEGSYIE